MRATPEHSSAEMKALDWLMPVQFFYLRNDRILPEVEFIGEDEMPEPQKGLLVHRSDMTPRLRAFHESEIILQVIDYEASSDYVMRSVVLRDEERNPVEFGAIGIRLEVFNEQLREEIVKGTGPLGGLLEKYRFPHTSSPKAYIRVKADRWISDYLNCEEGAVVFGRCNALLDKDGLTFADIVEILPHYE